MKKEIEQTLAIIAESYFRSQLLRLKVQTEGIKHGADIEYLHRMRVATRKLQSGLETFSEIISSRRQKNWSEDLQVLAKALGSARDLDVQALFLKSFNKEITNTKLNKGIERFLLRIKQERKKHQNDVMQSVKEFSKSRTNSEALKYFKSKSLGKRPSKKRINNPVFLNYVMNNIMFKIEEALSYDDFIHDPQNIEELHDLRKVTKSLRYRLETFEPYYKEHLGRIIKVTKNLQDYLGSIHDCDVWNDEINNFIDREKEYTKEYFGNIKPFYPLIPGLMYLLRDRKKERSELYSKFIVYWDEVIKSNIFITAMDKFDEPKSYTSMQPQPLNSAPTI